MKKYTLLLTLFLLIATEFVHAQAGTLDRNFGTNGKVSTDFADSSIDEGRDVIIQPDKKIILVGSVYANSKHSSGLARYLTDGSLDVSFGLNGKVITPFFNNTSVQINCGTLQPDGKIVVGGYTSEVFGGKGLSLLRYNPNGSVDSSFGTNGIIRTGLGIIGEGFQSLYVLPDGKILAAGLAGVCCNTDFILYRYNQNGKIDSTFANNGVATTDFGDDHVYSMAVQSDGKIVLGGDTFDYRSGTNKFMMVRYSFEGIKDSTFGKSGIVTTSFDLPGGAHCKAMVLQPDGKFVLGGHTYTSYGYVSIIARFLSTGKPDKAFGNGGLVQTNFRPGHYCTAAGIQKDGKIILGGYVYWGSDISEDNFTIARFKSDGAIDSTFGNNGLTITDIDKQVNWGNALAIQEDGKILLAGYTYKPYISNSGNFVIVRYNSDAKFRLDKLTKQINVKVYPNPVKDLLHIEGMSATSGTKLTITDINGNVRIATIINSSGYSLNVSHLTRGSYMLKIESGNSVATRNFIKE